MKKIIALAMAILIAAISIPLSLAGDTKGDVNGDNKVNSADALIILQITVGSYKGEISVKADVNGDGKINSADALMALQICVGLIDPTSKETTTKNDTIVFPTSGIIGAKYEDAYKQLTLLGFTVKDAIKDNSGSEKEGIVESATLDAGVAYPNGTTVYLLVWGPVQTTTAWDDDWDVDDDDDYYYNNEYPLDYKLKYKVGDKIDGTFKKKYMVRLYSNGQSKFIPSGESDYYTEPVWNTTTATQIGEFFLYLDSVDAIVSNIEESTVPHTYYDDDYNIIRKDVKKYTNYVSVTYKGHADKALNGKRILFNDPPFSDYRSSYYEKSFFSITDNVIKSDGSFDFTVVYKLDGDIYYTVRSSYSIDYLDTFDTESEWTGYLRGYYDEDEDEDEDDYDW